MPDPLNPTRRQCKRARGTDLHINAMWSRCLSSTSKTYPQA